MATRTTHRVYIKRPTLDYTSTYVCCTCGEDATFTDTPDMNARVQAWVNKHNNTNNNK